VSADRSSPPLSLSCSFVDVAPWALFAQMRAVDQQQSTQADPAHRSISYKFCRWSRRRLTPFKGRISVISHT